MLPTVRHLTAVALLALLAWLVALLGGALFAIDLVFAAIAGGVFAAWAAITALLGERRI